MTSAELIGELAKAQHLFEWKLVPDTGYAAEQRSEPRLLIRGASDDVTDGLVFEAMGAVCYVQTAKPYGDAMCMEAANALGLSQTDATDLLAASNDSTWRTVDRRREPDPRMQSLRKSLATAVHLEAQL